MGYEINWNTTPNNPVLSTPQYQKWSQYSFTDLIPLLPQVKVDLGDALAANESADVVNYLCWVCRVVALVA